MYPAGEPGISVQYVTLSDATRVRVLESGPALDHAVVLVHGWAASAYSFAETIPALAEAGHRVIAIDLPGFGLSDKPLGDSHYTNDNFLRVVDEAVSALGVRKFTFVGHSLGGRIALELAVRGDARLTALVLISAVGLGAAYAHPALRLFTPRLINRVVPALLTRPIVGAVLRMAFAAPGRPTRRDLDEYWAPTQFDEYAWACRATLHAAEWGRVPATRLRSLRLPVLVVTGGRDWLVRGVADRARLIPAARIMTVREGGHVVMQECAARVNPVLIEFLRGGRGTRSP